MNIFVLIMTFILFNPSQAVVGEYIDEKADFVCKVMTAYTDGSTWDYETNLCSATLVDPKTVLTAAHCEKPEYLGIDDWKTTRIIVQCPNSGIIEVKNRTRRKGEDLIMLELEKEINLSSYPSFPKNREEELEIATKGVCSIWGYGPDNQGNTGNLNAIPAKIELGHYRKVKPIGSPSLNAILLVIK